MGTPHCFRHPGRAFSVFLTIAALTAFCMSSSNFALGAARCPTNGNLPPGGNKVTDLLIDTPCAVVGLSGGVGVYVYRNVNIVAPGILKFADTRIDFHAESIIVENGGTLQAGDVSRPIGTNPAITGETGARLRIYLWGPKDLPAGDPGARCAGARCGVPLNLWASNDTLAMHMVPRPKNGTCKEASKFGQKLPDDDCFYKYDVIDTTMEQGKPKYPEAYFGQKVLGLSYGGTLQLFGVKGATYDTQVDNTPSATGTSWVRLAVVSADKKTLTLSVPVPTWKAGDHILVTTTDYMPTHNEEVVIDRLSGNNSMVVLTSPLKYLHNASVYTLPSQTPASIGPSDTRTIDTRAAVALLTRSIEITSEGDTPNTDPSGDHFPPNKGNYFGGQTLVRQGFTKYQVKGVEFYRLGQGGVIGRYPVHFHMARKTPQSDDPTKMSYLRDSSIHESMTRWITIHATQGMTIARNVGYLSIGHGFYLEDATEVNNKLYANLGASVIAAVQSDTLNPRNVPGILARPGNPGEEDFMPYLSDWNHPTAFWIMNGWNDFQYNMAAGVTSCGACYWLLPGANSGPSMFEVWDGNASQQLDVADGTPLRMNNRGRAGLSPLLNFVGNSCVAAMNSFESVEDTHACIGFSDGKVVDGPTLQAVPNPLAPQFSADPNNPATPAYLVYYPQLTGQRNATQCPSGDKGDCSVVTPCANRGPDRDKCMVTVLDHYVTSFNYAQTNFAAVWLRPKWILFTDGAVTDAQYGGLNFVTGGGYSRSDSPFGNWMLAYRSVFIGSSQGPTPANPYASAAGPFNPTTGLKCSNTSRVNYCLSTADGVSIQIAPFPGQRMFSLYDGPAFQKSNAYLETYPTLMSGDGWMYINRRENGLPKDSAGQCYLPNAAIAWKQPNGFYYPPAFHSQNLMFWKTNIRHFLIEPLFKESFPFKGFEGQGNPGEIRKRYCPGNDDAGMFNNFTHIDRQTVLNDGVPDAGSMPGGDGSLTGLVAMEKQPTTTNGRETISVNEDPFFNANPLMEKVECASDKHASDRDGTKPPGTAKTSPFEYVTTAIIPKCVKGQFSCPPPTGKMCDNECVEGGTAYWTRENGNSQSFGVPLYREYLTDVEYAQNPRPTPYILMMGQGSGQRSTLTLNHGRYYLDTSYNCDNQRLFYAGKPNRGGCLPFGQQPGHGVSVFLKNKEYYVYFVYGRASTQLTFDIYLGPNDETGKLKPVKPVRGIFNDGQGEFTGRDNAPWLTSEYEYDAQNSKGVLTVTVDLSKSPIAAELKAEFEAACAPKTYCEVKGRGERKTCGCKDGNKESCNEACSWGPKDPDCPEQGCYGFAFTMPSDWNAPAQPVPFNDVTKFSDVPYFQLGNVQFNALTTKQLKDFGQDSQCEYRK